MTFIAGIYHFNQDPVPGNTAFEMMKKTSNNLVNAMLWQEGPVFLGWSDNSTESVLHDSDGYKLVIAADSSIDNLDELSIKLDFDRSEEPSGNLLLLQAYQKWKKDMVIRLAGEYAFMIWDEREQSLFGARDVSGNRMLYYHANPNQFAFCTKMEALLTLPFIEKQLDTRWFEAHMNEDMEVADESLTPYVSINQLPPGFCMLVNNQIEIINSFSRTVRNKRIDSYI
ncbi:hypothetical protein [Oceanobacillus piezotolerans]|nr:hypothetical protein [Oceanobacillus piezotolerans]